MEVKYDNHLELPPNWACRAIWYQILVERFRNGDVSNDPDREYIHGGTVDDVPENWSVTPWGHNWYQQESWMENMPVDFYRSVQLRRYGGDLQGVIDKIPYLKSLGINAIYFNPLNQAPSLHKYDASCYHHIDPHFGPDPKGDLKIMGSEQPDDPSTWKWTSADLMFLHLIRICHEKEIRIIVDFSWNHTGHTFWAFEDIKRLKSNSPFLSWYQKIDFPKKGHQEVMKYTSWNQVSTLPELKKIQLSQDKDGLLRGDLPKALKAHIFDVCRRWITPHVDGEDTKGIDGMRLDVADLVPIDFWKELRVFTRGLQPDFFLVGEVWWEQWPDKLKDTKPWLTGDILDSVMHYQWFKVARMYFGEAKESFSILEFIGAIQAIYSGLKVEHCRALMNVTASHDSPRLLTSLYNKNIYKHHCKPIEDPEYKTGIPDKTTYELTKLLLIHQFTFLGSPHIWNGDEMGMVGADDPDNRKPLIWPDIPFEQESSSEYSSFQNYFRPLFDANLYKLYKDLIFLRSNFEVLQEGDCLFYTDEISDSPLLIYTRNLENETMCIVINRTQDTHKLPAFMRELKPVYQYNITNTLSEFIPPYSALIKKSF